MKNELIQKFKVDLEEGGKSPKTIENYVGDTVTLLEVKAISTEKRKDSI